MKRRVAATASNEDNPFFTIIGMMKGQKEDNDSVPFLIGTVVSAAPLAVKVGDITIDRSSMKINSFLLRGYQRRLRLDTTAATGQTAERGGGGGGYEAFSSHSHEQSTIGVPDGTFTTLDDFFVGEEVLLLRSADQQQFILLCKLA